uniref:Uncharacterized protein n=1 Tax=Rhizophora mucronata TaxID=61149 RepID=A0A2P2NEA1_RHIMU
MQSCFPRVANHSIVCRFSCLVYFQDL